MDDLAALVAAELAELVDPRVTRMAAAIAAGHGRASRAVLFYGSCLRTRELDGLMLDFYLIVSDYRAAYPKRWLGVANRLIPPNVFPFAHDGLQAKYAVLSEADFHRLNGPETLAVSVWARFSQPSRLVWMADDAARQAAVRAVSRAAPTLLSTVPRGRARSALDMWREAYRRTYRAELRAEKAWRGVSVVDADPGRYERFTAPALAAIDRNGASKPWWARRVAGKSLSVLRLAKASLTYAGGLDYLAWKINRHAGTAITIRPWQRRMPLLAALTLLPRLVRSGAIR